MEKTSVLAKLKQGDETSFTFVYDHYWRKVYRFSEIYLNDDEEIKEAVQEVFIMSRKQQMTNKEIAEQLDISEKAVERNIYFALKFIKKNLNLFIFFITIP